MNSTSREANQFELKHGAVHIRYSTDSLDGKPRLTYRDDKSEKSFVGDDIRVQPTEIALQVTVLLDAAPDLHTITLTLLIPTIHLDGKASPFDSEAIYTTHRTSIGGPDLVKGPIQSYRTLSLKGEARFIQS